MQTELGRMVMAGIVAGILGAGTVASAQPAAGSGRGRPGGGRRDVAERPDQTERTRERASARQRDETRERDGSRDDEGGRQPPARQRDETRERDGSREGDGGRQPAEGRERDSVWQRLRETFGERIRTFMTGQQEARQEGLRRIFAMEDAPAACRELIALIEGGKAAREAFFSGIHAEMLALVETWLDEREVPAERRAEILARMEARHADRHSAIAESEDRLLDRLRRALQRDDLTMEQLRQLWRNARQQAGRPREPRRDDRRDRDADKPRDDRRDRDADKPRDDRRDRDADKPHDGRRERDADAPRGEWRERNERERAPEGDRARRERREQA